MLATAILSPYFANYKGWQNNSLSRD